MGWEHRTSEMALSTQHHQPTNKPSGNHMSDHSYKLCLLTNRTAGSPVVTLDKSQHLQASGSIYCSLKGVRAFTAHWKSKSILCSLKGVSILCSQQEYWHLATQPHCLSLKGLTMHCYTGHTQLICRTSS